MIEVPVILRPVILRPMILRFAAMLVLAAPGIAVAQEVVVTASRVGSGQASPYGTRVIGPAQLAGQESVADALVLVSEIYVQAPGGRSGLGAIFLRGADPNFTTVFFEGIPLNNPANPLGGAVNASELPAGGLERVELVTGALSGLYGSGALAGAVNLIVPGGTIEHGLAVRAAIGTADTQAGLLQWRGPVGGRMGGSLALSHEAEEVVSPSRFRSTTLFGKLAPLGNNKHDRLVFRLATTRSDTFPDASGGDRLAVIRTLEERRSNELLVGGSQEIVQGQALTVTLAGSYLRRRDRTQTPGVAPSDFSPFGVPGGEDDTRLSRAIGQALVGYQGTNWSALAGLEGQHESARSTGALDFFGDAVASGFEDRRWTGSAFAEAEWRPSDLTVNTGLRVDKVAGWKARVTGRSGLNYRFGDSGWSARAAFGTAFKAPSFYALGNPFVGNPDLNPERSRTLEAGVSYQATPWSIDLVAFHSRFAQLIDFVSEPVLQLINRSRVISKDVTLSGSAEPSRKLSLSAQVTFADTRDSATDEQLLNRPRWRGVAAVVWRATGQLTLLSSYQRTGPRQAFSAPSGPVELGAFQTIRAEAAYAFSPAVTARVILDNAFDEIFEHAVGFASPGQRARLALSATL